MHQLLLGHSHFTNTLRNGKQPTRTICYLRSKLVEIAVVGQSQPCVCQSVYKENPKVVGQHYLACHQVHVHCQTNLVYFFQNAPFTKTKYNILRTHLVLLCNNNTAQIGVSRIIRFARFVELGLNRTIAGLIRGRRPSGAGFKPPPPPASPLRVLLQSGHRSTESITLASGQ